MLSNNGKVEYTLLASTIQRCEHDFIAAEHGQTVTQWLLQLLETTTTAEKQVHDANIVATMLIHGVDTIFDE